MRLKSILRALFACVVLLVLASDVSACHRRKARPATSCQTCQAAPAAVVPTTTATAAYTLPTAPASTGCQGGNCPAPATTRPRWMIR